MAKAKFKRGDVIRINDSTDPAHPHNNFYKILHIHRNEYILQSLQTYSEIGKRDLVHTLLRHDVNMIKFIDKYYRLVTETERILYGRKEIQGAT